MSRSEHTQPLRPVAAAAVGAPTRDHVPTAEQWPPAVTAATAVPAPRAVGAPVTAPPPAPGVERRPIFVARTGRRKWLLRLASLLVVAVCVGYFWALMMVLTDVSGSNQAAPATGLTAAVPGRVVVLGAAGGPA